MLGDDSDSGGDDESPNPSSRPSSNDSGGVTWGMCKYMMSTYHEFVFVNAIMQ